MDDFLNYLSGNVPLYWTSGFFIVVCLICLFYQTTIKKSKITNFTRAEYYLVKIGKIDLSEMTSYHSAVNWSTYAGFSFTALFLAFTVSREAPGIEILLPLIILLISAVIMAVVDRSFTNNLSPMIPINTRFRITKICILWGWIGFVLMLYALALFFSGFYAAIGPLIALLLLASTLRIGYARAVPIKDIVQKFNLNKKQESELLACIYAKRNPWNISPEEYMDTQEEI